MTQTSTLPPLVDFPDGFERYFPRFLAETATRVGPAFRRLWRDSDGDEHEFYFLVGPEANRLVFHTARERFSHDKGWTPIIGERMGHGLLNMDGEEWARNRRMMNPAFTSAYMATYVPVFNQVIERRTREWPARDWVDLQEETREITFDAAAAALVGMSQGPEVDRCREIFYGLFHTFDPAKESWDSFRARWAGMLGELHRMVLGWIADRRRSGAQSPTDVLGMIVNARDENGEALSDEQVLAHVKILLLAGHETTTSQSAWLLYLLFSHPEVLARAEAEVREHADGAPLTFEALREMDFLGDCVREAGRLHPPVVTVPRGVVEDVELNGHVIPAGANVRVGIGGTHRLPNIFADPERYDPDRLRPPREEDKKVPYSLVTFGGGPRVCIGINFAQIEMRALAAHVLRTYRLEPLADQEIVPISFITTFLQNGIKVRVTPRRM